MPKIVVVNGYQISIWSNENGEPIHVHVSKKRPNQNSTKLWLLSNGKFVIAHNKGRIQERELNSIIEKLNALSLIVREFWIGYHGYEKYYK